jgi:hypothetical protein
VGAYAVGGGHGEQVVAGAASRVDRGCVEQGTDLAHRVAVLDVRHAVDQGSPGGRAVESEDQSHGGGLTGAIRAEEAGYPARCDLDSEPVDSGLLAEPLGQAGERDHGANLGQEPTAGHRPSEPVDPDFRQGRCTASSGKVVACVERGL